MEPVNEPGGERVTGAVGVNDVIDRVGGHVHHVIAEPRRRPVRAVGAYDELPLLGQGLTDTGGVVAEPLRAEDDAGPARKLVLLGLWPSQSCRSVQNGMFCATITGTYERAANTVDGAAGSWSRWMIVSQLAAPTTKVRTLHSGADQR